MHLVLCPNIDIKLRILVQKKFLRKDRKPHEIHMGILQGQH